MAGCGLICMFAMVALRVCTCRCVHEVDEALEAGLTVRGIGDFAAYGLGDANTAEATCGFPDDDRRIRSAIQSKQGGYQRLNVVITKFRQAMIKGACLFRNNPSKLHLDEEKPSHTVLTRRIIKELRKAGNYSEEGVMLYMLRMDGTLVGDSTDWKSTQIGDDAHVVGQV